MLNQIVLMGRLTRDVELRYTQSGTPVASFTLAVDRDYKDADGNRGVDFIDIVAWRQGGEFAANNFAKGQQVAVAGRLQMRSYTDKNGNSRTEAEVVANNLYFAGNKRETAPREAEYTPPGSYQEVRQRVKEQDSVFAPEYEDDGKLPF